ncbi:hypothetical protein LZ30DRAFT_793306 [Colletotrichum cereale]|nr:hypothetical protein LZ30DRAFT_793306 [Colletotrichum cereale]
MRTTLKNLQPQNTRASIEFELIPFIFVPGSLVIRSNSFLSHLPTYWAAVLERCQFVREGDNTILEISMIYTGFDGTSFGPVVSEVSIPSYHGSKLISELPVYPIKYHSSAESLLNELETRGRKHTHLCSESASESRTNRPIPGFHRDYSGPLWEPTDDGLRRRTGSSSRGSFVSQMFGGSPSSQVSNSNQKRRTGSYFHLADASVFWSGDCGP